MTVPTPEAVAGQVDREELMRHVQQFARRVKLSGTPDELESFKTLRETLDGYGLATRLLQHDALISLPGASRVVVDGREVASITHSFSRPSPAAGLSAPLADVGAGTAADFAGKEVSGRIVLVDGIASPAVAHRATEAGAVGLLHVSPHEHLHEMCISPVWGSPSSGSVGALPATVANSISAADGAALRARLATGALPSVTLHAEVDTSWRKTPILISDLEAGAASSAAPFVLFSGHHDTWYYGVMDNGTANATMLEVGRLAARHRAHLRRGLRLCFWSGHSHGRYSGSAWYAEEHWSELEARCLAHINVDSTGGAGATVLSNGAAMPELAGLVGEAIRVEAGSDYVGKPMARSSDQSFWGIGLPSALGSLSEQPPGPVKLRNQLGWWWHTPHDTLEHIDAANLVRDTKVFVHVLWRLLADPVAPLDFAATVNELKRELTLAQGEVGRRFDIGTLIAGANDLAARLSSQSGIASERATHLQMRLARALVPLHTLSADRFVHDPALPQPPWPPIAALRAVARTSAGTDAEHLALVAARRARNRIGEALATARGLF